MKFTSSVFVVATLMSTSNAIQAKREHIPSYPAFNSEDGKVVDKQMYDTCKKQLGSNNACSTGTMPNVWFAKESDAQTGANKEMKIADEAVLTTHSVAKDDYDWIKNAPLSIQKFHDYMGDESSK